MSINEGDWVYLRIMKQRLKQVGKKCPKLSFRMYGPFSVVKKVNNVSMKLCLPPSWTMHDVFNVSWLKVYQGPPPAQVPDEEQPYILDEAEFLEPEQILLHRFKHGLGKKVRQYLTKFKDRGTHEAVWLDVDFFQEYPDLLASYQEAMQDQPQLKQEGMSHAQLLLMCIVDIVVLQLESIRVLTDAILLLRASESMIM